jgi:hypothetical protein
MNRHHPIFLCVQDTNSLKKKVTLNINSKNKLILIELHIKINLHDCTDVQDSEHITDAMRHNINLMQVTKLVAMTALNSLNFSSPLMNKITTSITLLCFYLSDVTVMRMNTI